jgi:hypothetical protein
VEAFVEALEEARGAVGRGHEQMPSAHRPTRKGQVGLTRRAFAVGLVGGAGGWYLLHERLTPLLSATAFSASHPVTTPTDRAVLTFTGHLAGVNAVAWSPDGHG